MSELPDTANSDPDEDANFHEEIQMRQQIGFEYNRRFNLVYEYTQDPYAAHRLAVDYLTGMYGGILDILQPGEED